MGGGGGGGGGGGVVNVLQILSNRDGRGILGGFEIFVFGIFLR